MADFRMQNQDIYDNKSGRRVGYVISQDIYNAASGRIIASIDEV